jgi:hypothetical protein
MTRLQADIIGIGRNNQDVQLGGDDCEYIGVQGEPVCVMILVTQF